MDPTGRPKPLESRDTSESSIEVRTPRSGRDGPLFQVVRGAPLLSPVSPVHKLHSGDPRVSLAPTPGCPDSSSSSSSIAQPSEHHKGAAPSDAGLPACDACGESLGLDQDSLRHLPPAYFMNDCGHVFSKGCLLRHVRGAVQRPGATRASVCCPARGCGTPLAPCDLLNFVNKQEHARLLATEMDALVDSESAGYIVCPQCQIVFERAGEGAIGPSGCIDSSGHPISPRHVEHYRKHRFRCPSCPTGSDFCGACGAHPYHTGSTCAEHESLAKAKLCRFCGKPAAEQPQHPSEASSPRKRAPTCGGSDCERSQSEACPKILPCGHPCVGMAGEAVCPPCLVQGCPANTTGRVLTSWCSICYTEELRAAPCVVLACSHVFHYKCVNRQLLQKWPGARISFGFMTCPECSQEISHPSFKELLRELNAFRTEVRSGALLRLRHEGLDKDPAVASPSGQYFNDPAGYADAVLSYYQCYVCERPYFGGVRRCEQGMQDEEEGRYNPSELVCASCVPFRELKSCRQHGSEFIEYKCKFCCSVAQWFCWGTTHFCSSCHRLQERGDFVTKKKLADLPHCTGWRTCPLKVDHPPNGTEEFALGCAVCRLSSTTTF